MLYRVFIFLMIVLSSCTTTHHVRYINRVDFERFWNSKKYTATNISNIEGEYRRVEGYILLKPDSVFIFRNWVSDVPGTRITASGRYYYGLGKLVLSFREILQYNLFDSTELRRFQDSLEYRSVLNQLSCEYSPAYFVNVDEQIFIFSGSQYRNLMLDTNYIKELTYEVKVNDKIVGNAALLKMK